MVSGFMAGFGTTLSELIEKDREYYRAKAEKRKDYLQTYGTKAVVDIESKANDALSVANRLQNFGFSKEFVTGITTKSGVRGMYDFAEQVLKRTDLTPADIKELETSAVDFVNSNPEEDLETVINRAYGLYKSESDPVRRKTGMLGAMLGLDARAMEDEVINADYYGGYSGQDLIRIAASSGPKAGKPLGIKLPPKPLSATEYGSVNQVVNSTFDSSLARHMDELGQLILQGGPEVQATMERLKELEAIQTLAKSDPNAAMTTYLRSYDTKGEFLSYLQGLEGGLGRISNNFLLGKDLTATFTALSGDQRDNDIQTITASGREGTSNAAPRSSESSVTKKAATYTQDQIQAAVNNGDIKVGDTIIVDGTKIEVKQGFVDTYKTTQPPAVSDAAVIKEGLTRSDAIDDKLAMQRREAALNDLELSVPTPGLTNDDMGLPDGPIPKSLIPDIQAGAETMEWILATTDSEAFDTSILSNALKLSAAAQNGTARAIDFLTGIVGGTEETGVSKSLKSASKYQLEQAAEVAAKGFTEYWTGDLEDGDGFTPEFPGDVPEGVVKEVKGSYLDAIMDMLGMSESSETRVVNGTPMTDAEILAAARAQLDEAANARIDAGTNTIEQSRLENATPDLISKSLRFLTEIPERIHQALFDPEDKIDTYVASLFEETLEERIMKNEGQRNRVVALQALKDKISDLRKEAEAEKPNGDTSFEYTDSPVPMEPLVTRPKRTKKPKGMTASDKARLQRAQKANELSGDSSLLEMLVEKYGIALVQKEMGL
jgi:hypothetical protein